MIHISPLCDCYSSHDPSHSPLPKHCIPHMYILSLIGTDGSFVLSLLQNNKGVYALKQTDDGLKQLKARSAINTWMHVYRDS